uniref:Uncharacterized protein n=1 Tax=Anguilla anguilla TaxID=7936 RepID=A0A0E9PFR4_ANGAN
MIIIIMLTLNKDLR